MPEICGTIHVLSVVFSEGKERGYIETNPAADIKALKRHKDAPAANRSWTDSKREIVLAALPEHMKLPITLMMFCGLDPVDVLTLSRNAIKDEMIDIRRAKTKEPVWIPLPTPVRRAIENVPPHTAITVCANSYGKVWTTDGFNTNWQKIRNKLLGKGLVQSGLTLKGLRHTVATILAEMGYVTGRLPTCLGRKLWQWRSTIQGVQIVQRNSPALLRILSRK